MSVEVPAGFEAVADTVGFMALVGPVFPMHDNRAAYGHMVWICPKESDLLLKAIGSGDVIVVMNGLVASAAEGFIMRLSQAENVVLHM